MFDFSHVSGDAWSPAVRTIDNLSINRKPDGGWLDRWTAGSPLVWDRVAYIDDLYATFYAVDLTSGRLLYRSQTQLAGLFHYNAIPVAASPALGGSHIFISDNQGTTLILKPGPEFQQVACNRIETVLARTIPIPGQEEISYAPPVFEGSRIYLRGERYLYCIGEERD